MLLKIKAIDWLGLFLLFQAVFFSYILDSNSSQSISLALLLQFFASFLCLSRGLTYSYFSKKVIFFLLFCSLLFSIQLFSYEKINFTFFVDHTGLLKSLFRGSTFISTNILLIPLLEFFNHPRLNSFPSISLRAAFVFLLIETVIFISSVFPVIVATGDVFSLYSQVINNRWDDWFCIEYQLIVKFCTLIYQSPYTVIIFQSISWLLLNYYILSFIAKLNKKTVLLYCILLCLNIIPFLFLTLLSHDTLFSLGILALTVFLFKIIHCEMITKTDLSLFFFFNLFVLCRHCGAIILLISSSTLLVYCIYKKKKKLIKLVTCILIFQLFLILFINTLLMNNILHAKKNPSYIKYSTPISLIGAAVTKNIKFSVEDNKLLIKYLPIDKWKKYYSHDTVDTLSRPWCPIGLKAINRLDYLIEKEHYGKDILKINLKLFLQHPSMYCNALLKQNRIMWKISDNALTTAAGYFGHNNPEMKVYFLNSANTLHALESFIKDFPVTRALSYNCGFCFFLLLFMFGFLVLKKLYNYLVTFIPIGVNILLLAITIPAQDIRFMLPATLIVPFLIVMICHLSSNKNLEGDGYNKLTHNKNNNNYTSV